MGAPIVREWQPDRRRSVLFAIDCGRLMRAQAQGENKLDAALRAVARLALAAEARGDQVGVLAYASEVLRFVPPLSGASQAERLLRFLADIEPQPVESQPSRALPTLLAQGRRALVVWVTDVMDQVGVSALVSAVTQVATRHLPLVTLVRDPHLDDAFQRPVRRALDGYRRSAAELVAHDRHDALEHLRARRVAALDLSMRALALEVVDRYLKLRARQGW
jgi:uncharacterized protein (DUF58 family)